MCRTKRRLKERSVLVRIVSIAVILACLPLLIFSVSMTVRGKNDILNARKMHAQNIAEAACSYWVEWIMQMLKVAQSISSERKLPDHSLNVTTYGDREAVEALRAYIAPLPFIGECGLYSQRSSEVIFTSRGKYDLDVYLQHVLGMDRRQFSDFIAQEGGINFLPWNVARSSILCSVTLNPYSEASTRRVCLFVIPRKNVEDYFQTILGDGDYHLAALFNADQQLLYVNKDKTIDSQTVRQICETASPYDDSTHTYFVSNPKSGQSAVIFIPLSAYALGAASFEHALHLVILADILISLILIALACYVTYRPLARLMRSLDLQSSFGKNEYEMIQSAYSLKEARIRELVTRDSENRTLIVKQLIEKLLDGNAVNAQEAALLDGILGTKGRYFAAIARLNPEADPDWIKDDLSCAGRVFPFEMYRDGFYVFLCRINGEEERVPLAHGLQKGTGVPLSVGGSVAHWKALHNSYLQAICAFDDSAALSLYEQFHRDAQAEKNDHSVDLMQMARALKNGDEAALQYMRAIFDGIERSTPSFLLQRYACFQLVENLRRTLAKLEISMSSNQAAHIVSQNSLPEIRSACLSVLADYLQQVREMEARRQSDITEQIRHLLQRKFTHSDLGLSDLAEALQMPEKSASRLFKEYMGVNFTKYVATLRIDQAKQLLLTTDLSIAEIAEKTGFASSAYFVRVFKAEAGLSPSAYRQSCGAGNRAQDFS